MASTTAKVCQQDFNSSEPEFYSRGSEVGEEDEINRSGDSECSDESSESQDDIDESVLQEMADLEETFHGMGLKYRMIDRIGEGMAKSVTIIPNKDLMFCLLGTFSTVYKAEDLQYDYYQNDWDREPSAKWLSPPVKKRRKYYIESPPPGQLRKKAHFVAIKKIYVTSSPMRIQNELELLHILRGYRSVCTLITAFRHQDQVVAVLPYFSHHDFRVLSPFL